MNRFLLVSGLLCFLASCKTPVFTTVNNMRLINGVVTMNDGTRYEGSITSNTEDYRSNPYITLTQSGSKESRRIYLSEIKFMSVRGNTYEPKVIDMGRKQLLFVKRLTKEDSRIQLYELYEQKSRTNQTRYGTTSTAPSDEYSYYITTPSHGPQDMAWNIEGRHLTPNFEDKMSEIVKDCPSLADKIRKKEKGYFYAQISLVQEKRIETMMNIIEEYNRCKNK